MPLNSRKILKKKNKLGGLTLPGFKTFYKTTVIGAVWTGLRAERTEPRARHYNQVPTRDPSLARPLKGSKSPSDTRCWQGWMPARTSTNADPHADSHADYLSQVKNLNAKAKAMKLLQKKREQTFIISDLALASRYDAMSVSNKGENR